MTHKRGSRGKASAPSPSSAKTLEGFEGLLGGQRALNGNPDRGRL